MFIWAKKQNYLGNKKPTFLACSLEQVYAAILEFSELPNDILTIFFRTSKPALAGFLKFSEISLT